MSRPTVSLIVPFRGEPADAHRAIASLSRLHRGPGDEVLIVDNSATGRALPEPPEGIRLVRAAGGPSPYGARNAGAREASGDWLLFTDADCRSSVGLLDSYFDPFPASWCGAVAGEIHSDPTQASLVARWARSRERLSQRRYSLAHPFRPYGSTANLLVRRAAFDEIGGFVENVRSGGDADLCWRLQESGWELEYRGEAVVVHRHREALRSLLQQAARYGSGHAWLERRYPGNKRAPVAVRILGLPLHALTLLVRGRFEAAAFRLLDAVSLATATLARPLPNTLRIGRSGSPPRGSHLSAGTSK